MGSASECVAGRTLDAAVGRPLREPLREGGAPVTPNALAPVAGREPAPLFGAVFGVRGAVPGAIGVWCTTSRLVSLSPYARVVLYYAGAGETRIDAGVRLPVLSAGSDLGWRTDGVGLWHCSHYHTLQSCPT